MALKALPSNRHYNNSFHTNEEFCEYNKFSCTDTYSNEAYPKNYKNCFKIAKKTNKSVALNKKNESHALISTNTYTNIPVPSQPLETNSTHKRFSASFLKTPAKKPSTSLHSSTVLYRASSTLIQNSNNQSVNYTSGTYATKHNQLGKRKEHIEELKDLKHDSLSQLITTVTPQTCAIKSISHKYEASEESDYLKIKARKNNGIYMETNKIKNDFIQNFTAINSKTTIGSSSPSLSSSLTSSLSPSSSFFSHPIIYNRSFSLPHNPFQHPTAKRVSFDLKASKCYYTEKILRIDRNNECKVNNKNHENPNILTGSHSVNPEKNIFFQNNHDVLDDKNEFSNVKTDKANQNNCQDSSYLKINKQGNYHEENKNSNYIGSHALKFETKSEEKINNTNDYIHDNNKNSENIGLNNVDDDIVVMNKNLGLTHISSNKDHKHQMFQNEISQDENSSESHQLSESLQHHKSNRDSLITNIFKIKQLPLSKTTQHLHSLPPICPHNAKKSNIIKSQRPRHHLKSNSESNIHFGDCSSFKATELSIIVKNKLEGEFSGEKSSKLNNNISINSDSSVTKSPTNDFKTSLKVGYSCVKGHRRKASLGTKDFLNEFPNLVSDNVQYKLKAGI